MNTKFEVSTPGFLCLDFVNQIRKEEKIGGGGAAIIYKGALLDQKLKEVFFFSFQTKLKWESQGKKKKKKKKFKFEEVAIKQIFDDQALSPEDNKTRFEQEISIMWGISSHPNIVTLVGYSDHPRCIITKVFFLFFSFLFF